jgi:hypothetical protein
LKNFAKLHKMKKHLEEFRKEFNQLDTEWKRVVESKVIIGDVFRVYNQLENIELDELNIEPAEMKQFMKPLKGE